MVKQYVGLFNKILDTSTYPEAWSLGLTIPIYKKKGDKKDCNNYRGITLLSCLGKLFTTVLNERRKQYCDINEIKQVSEPTIQLLIIFYPLNHSLIGTVQGNMFWYCTTCKDSAVSAVKADKVVEEKCKEFLESFEKSLREEAIKLIKTTCDKYMLTITKRLEAVEQKLNSTVEARQSSSTTMGTLQANEREGQAIDCLQDRMARKNNVVFFGVSEAEGSTREDKMADNKAKIVSIASEIGVQLKDEDILFFKRLGKMGQTRMVKDEEVSLPRLLLVTLTEAAKAALMKNAYKLQFSTSEMKEIQIKHDMSKEDRQREYELRQEARQKQMDNTDQDFLYRVRGPNWDRKIVKIMQFVSKVAKEAKEVPPATDKETENQD